MDADVIIVGAGPTGLMLAVELRLAGVDALVLERHPQIREIPKAGGLSGQIVEVLRYRGLLERFEVASPGPVPALRLPFGEVHVDMTRLPEPPMHLLLLPQPRLEGVLDELARELGAEIRREHEVVGLSQDDTGGRRGRARAGRAASGDRSVPGRLRRVAQPGARPGRLPVPRHHVSGGQPARPDHRARRGHGARERRPRGRGVGRFNFGFTRTERGVFAAGSSTRRGWASSPARRRPQTTTTTSR